MKIDVKKNSNYFWKILFTFFIAYIHSPYNGHTAGWYLCVDFFFFSSGFVLAMSNEKDTFRYIMRRTKKLWPHLLLSYIMIYSFYFRGSIKVILNQMMIHIGESTPYSYFFFDLEYAGRYHLNFPAWYVTCLLVCSMIIHYLYFNHKKFFVSAFAPVLIILIYGHIYRISPSLNVGGDVGPFLNEYYLRGFAGMSVGVICFYILNSIKDYKFSESFYILIRIVEIIAMSSFAWIALIYGNQKTDMLLLGVLFIGAFCSFVHPQNNRKSIAHEIIKRANSYTYACYLNHIFVVLMMGAFFENCLYTDNLVCYYVIIVLLSVITQNILFILCKQFEKLKNAFILDRGK